MMLRSPLRSPMRSPMSSPMRSPLASVPALVRGLVMDADFTRGILPPTVTLTRASAATVFCAGRYGDTKVTNGTFDTNTAGWTTTGDVSLASVAGKLRVTKNAGGFATQQCAGLTPGALYRFEWSATAGTAGPYVIVGTTAGNANLMLANGGSGDQFGFFTAPSNGTAWLSFGHNGGTTGNYVDYDNIVLRELTIWRPGMDWYGPELVANGDFSSGLAGWNAVNQGTGNIEALNGAARFTTINSSNRGELSKQVATVAGRTYTASVKVTRIVGINGVNFSFTDSQNFGEGTSTLTQVAPYNNQFISMLVQGNSGTIDVDNVSVREQLYTWGIYTLPADVPRFAYDPVTLAPLGLLIEPQRTNLVPYSSILTGWTPSGAAATTLTAVTGVGSGAGGAKLTPAAGASSNDFGRIREYLTTTAGTHVCSVALKADGYGFAEVILSNSNTSYTKFVALTFNLSTGAFVSQRSTSYSAIAYGSAFDANGFRRYWFSVACDANSTHAIVVKACSTSNPINIFAADGTSGIVVDAVQLEAGTEPSTYIPTNGAAATRAADVVIAPFTASAQGTFTVSASVVNPARGTPQRIVGNDSAPDAVIGLAPNGRGETYNSVTGPLSMSLPAAISNVPFAAAVSYSQSGRMACMDGGAVASDGLAFQTINTRLVFGSRGDGVADAPMVGCIRRLRYFRRALAANELQALTRLAA